jgi:hypothetical protein
MTHSHPSEILTEPYVIASFKAQDLGIKGESLVEVSDPDADERHIGDHAAMLRRHVAEGFS